jgi:hypothetical protein
MAEAAHLPGWVYMLMGWVAGSASTVAGSWIASKIYLYHAHRDAHRDKLKERVLAPLLEYLENQFRPLVTFSAPTLEARWTELAFNEGAGSTEEPRGFGEVLETVNPWWEFKSAADEALYHDARSHHFQALIRRSEEFASGWQGYCESLLQWIHEMAREIERATELPPLKLGPGERGYAAHVHLAMFVYKRVSQLQSGSLSRSSTGSSFYALSDAGGVTVALAAAPKIEHVILVVDALINSEQSKGDSFAERAGQLSAQLDALIGELKLAVASTSLPGRCGLVRFF